jgi:hypothetical protein
MKTLDAAAVTARSSGTGSSPDRPLYMKIVYDDGGSVRKGLILAVVGIGLAVAQGIAATQSQRAGSNPDFGRVATMRFWHAVSALSYRGADRLEHLARHAATEYNKARI